MCLAFNQSMVFGFVERIGFARGFESAQVHAVLVALGVVNVLPGALAAMLQQRCSPVAAWQRWPSS